MLYSLESPGRLLVTKIRRRTTLNIKLKRAEVQDYISPSIKIDGSVVIEVFFVRKQGICG